MEIKSLVACTNAHSGFSDHSAFVCAEPLVKYAKRHRIRLKRIDFTTAQKQLLSNIPNISATIYCDITRFQILEPRSESVQRVRYPGQSFNLSM